MHRLRVLAQALACILLFLTSAAQADKPLWDLGLGLTVLDFPDYRGSDERNTYALPIPYVIYRGEILDIDRAGIRGLFFKTDRINIRMSISGSVPVDSARNSARQGMPDLDPTVQIGLNPELRLYRDQGSGVRVDLRSPLRTVIATDFRHSHNVGWIWHPRINVDFSKTPLGEGWNLGISMGPLYGDKRYHNYYYGVAPEFATARRPQFIAEGGYAGTQFNATISKRFEKMWFGAFVRWDSVAGAVFDTSPLIRQQDTFAAGFAITWVLKESQQRVPDRD